MLEFPIVGAAITAVAIVVIKRAGRAIAGIGGLLVGVGGLWLALFGRVALTCGTGIQTTCFAPDIGAAVVTSAAIGGLGVAVSIFAALRARRT